MTSRSNPHKQVLRTERIGPVKSKQGKEIPDEVKRGIDEFLTPEEVQKFSRTDKASLAERVNVYLTPSESAEWKLKPRYRDIKQFLKHKIAETKSRIKWKLTTFDYEESSLEIKDRIKLKTYRLLLRDIENKDSLSRAGAKSVIKTESFEADYADTIGVNEEEMEEEEEDLVDSDDDDDEDGY